MRCHITTVNMIKTLISRTTRISPTRKTTIQMYTVLAETKRLKQTAEVRDSIILVPLEQIKRRHMQEEM